MIRREAPPTAGLPLGWRDFVARGDGESLEHGFARFLGVPAVQAECSGTACLWIALETLKRTSARRTVVVPAYTCPLVPLAVARAGLRVRLCDIARDRFELDAARLGDTCDDDTLAIVPTHLGGIAANLDPVLEIAHRAGAIVIEDAAQALGARWHGEPVGTIGDVGFYSLARGKGLTLFEGGLLVAREPRLRAALAETSRARIPARRAIEIWRLVQLVGYAATYRPSTLAFVYGLPLRYWLSRGDAARAIGDVARSIPLHRVSSLRKRVGASALARLESWQRAAVRRGQARALRLCEIDGIDVLSGVSDNDATWPFLMVVFRSADVCERAIAKLWRSGLGVTRLFASDLTGYDFLAGCVPREAMPNARSFAARCLTVSNSPWLDDAAFDRIVRTLAAVA